jgi:hypothetical protein
MPRKTLFSVPFRSKMTDDESNRLRATLDLVMFISPKPGVSGASLGVVPLDFWSALYLDRGAGDDEWVLEGRTWGSPPERAVHDWYVRTALGAKEIDPSVEVPPPAGSKTPAQAK